MRSVIAMDTADSSIHKIKYSHVGAVRKEIGLGCTLSSSTVDTKTQLSVLCLASFHQFSFTPIVSISQVCKCNNILFLTSIIYYFLF